MKEVKSQDGTLILVFNSVAEIESYVDANQFDKRGNQRESFVGRRFDGWEDVVKAQREKWDHGLEVIQAATERLLGMELPEVRSRKRKATSNEVEGEFDYEKFMGGDQQIFTRYSREESHGPGEVTVITDTTTPCSKDTDDILWRGAVSLALTKILEDRGYSVELWVVNGSQLFSGSSKPVCTACRLKKQTEPLDMSTLTNVVSGWFYRSATFTLLDTICDKHGKQAAYGYGYCYTPMAADLNELSNDPFRIYSTGAYSFSGAVQQLAAELERVKKNNQQ